MGLYYKYTTLPEANAFCATVNAGEGIPVSGNSVTQTYTAPISIAGDYYVVSDSVTSKYNNETPVALPLIIS